ncbi:amino acid ABC transporter permease [Moraxella oblonga]|nr:amino acid ABC transporter permease [Moraxella oblonga]
MLGLNWQYIWQTAPRFFQAALMTLELAVYGIVLSLLLGGVVAIFTAYKTPILNKISRAYIELSRNTPLLIQLFFLYYGLPKIGIKWSGFTCGVIALVFLGGSYMAEALRAGLIAVPKGQIEAGKAIGLNKIQIFWYVVLPQAWAIALPAVGANVLFLIKETSVISAVAVVELMFLTKDIIGMDYKTNEALFLLFISYLLILLPVAMWARWAEKKARSAKYGT